ncbi:putative ABC transport system permease protein [Flavobacterium swingsii]|jgi:putative ABC transport system permease protein|uniref:Putative ABC transport system permease protein n=1 Tax=Flavobacterium swingsii TaxID=498292 RepID=A0A1I0YD33_9FLAO|nr:ABC transporter permease [Flavobacterium swingsii]SFB10727.1 putative ABC transport system permease protein [Flavobacterium swingsii]
MILYMRLLKESFSFAINALRNNKLRTLLSLLGVTIGIFSIIAVLAAVDSLDKKIKDDLSSLDKNSIYLLKDSFGPTEVPDWKKEQFPNVTYEEYEYLSKSLNDLDAMCFQMFTKQENIKYEGKTVSSINVIPTTYELEDIQALSLKKGRFFNESESNSGTPLVILGHDIAQNLFESIEPIGKKVRLYGQTFTVIGVLKKKGASVFDEQDDTTAYIPSNFLRRLYGDNNEMVMPAILIKPVDGVDIEAFKGELKQKLRNHRGIKIGEIDNFFVNVLSGLTDMIDEIISLMDLVGIAIAFFSLLVGGFGIANIMFVSVKERTNLIGIQKSLGAKNRFILLQFLFEAIVLSLFGGIIGIFLVWIISLLLTHALDFEFALGFMNIIIGTGISVLIGIIAGIIPAYMASKLDPVEAIRSGM